METRVPAKEQVVGRRSPSAAGPKSCRNLRILVAEDNLVNQRLAVGLLERRGHTAILAGNGREAIVALENDQFDMVLMDVQMPQMSGLEATAAIRLKESETGKHIPIIAITAHAMKGDRERCLDAGMDDYVSKPIQPELLFTTIDRLAATTKRVTVDNSTAAIMDSEATMFATEEPDWTTLNISAALEALSGDEEVLQEIAEMFLDECPKMMRELEVAIAKRDGILISAAAHSIGGVVANFGAQATSDLALRIEVMGVKGELADAAEASSLLEQEIKRLMPAISALARGELAGVS
jgi:CheY-like chemotaxis protein